MKRSFLACLLCAAAVIPAAASDTITFTWTWPTTRTDGSALPLSAIGSATVYDTSQPAPGALGTVVACPVTIPPTTANGTCTTGSIAGGMNDSYVLVVGDNQTPPDLSAASNAVTVAIPLAAPSAVSNFAGAAN